MKLELEMKGLDPKKSNIRQCDFRTKLLEYCRDSFEMFFKNEDEKEEKEESAEDKAEKALKKKEKLFGNIHFVGELYKRYLIADGIVKTVFTNLLGMGDTATS